MSEQINKRKKNRRKHLQLFILAFCLKQDALNKHWNVIHIIQKRTEMFWYKLTETPFFLLFVFLCVVLCHELPYSLYRHSLDITGFP